MGKVETVAFQKKVANIQRGAYYFGIIGRLSILFGGGHLVVGLFFVFTGENSETYRMGVQALVNSLNPLINGWLFLLGRDAFEAIQQVVTELGEIV